MILQKTKTSNQNGLKEAKTQRTTYHKQKQTIMFGHMKIEKLESVVTTGQIYGMRDKGGQFLKTIHMLLTFCLCVTGPHIGRTIQ